MNASIRAAFATPPSGRLGSRPCASAALWAALGIGLLCVVGCATSIQAIREDPQRFHGRTVTISGKVDRAISVPLTDYSVQTVSDSSGSVVVVTATRRDRGQDLRLRGRIVAFPEAGTVDKADSATGAIADFLVERGAVSREGAQKSAERVIAIIAKIAEGLGSLFVVVEE